MILRCTEQRKADETVTHVSVESDNVSTAQKMNDLSKVFPVEHRLYQVKPGPINIILKTHINKFEAPPENVLFKKNEECTNLRKCIS